NAPAAVGSRYTTASTTAPESQVQSTVSSSPTNPAAHKTNPAVAANSTNPAAAPQKNPTRPNPLADVPRPVPGPGSKAFQIYQGRFAFDLNEVPLIGSPTARGAIVSLFDYTCHHCRVTHPI